MNGFAILLISSSVLGQGPASLPANNATQTPAGSPTPHQKLAMSDVAESAIHNNEWRPGNVWTESARSLLKGDTQFPRFIYPVSNPVFAKDPRATTHLRGLFIHNEIPGGHALGGGDLQAVAAQINVAVGERLSIIADKDGYAWLNPHGARSTTGTLNLGAGLKYALVRDVENQFILAGGFMYEIPSGSSGAFSGHGDGAFAFFLTGGKEFAERIHVLNTTGYYVPVNASENSSFFYSSFHVDYQVNCWFYPLAELNWFHYVAGGDRGLPPALGEGDGLINFGTSGVAGNDLVTFALGARAVLSQNVSVGGAYEFPLSNRRDLIQNRYVFDLILRY